MLRQNLDVLLLRMVKRVQFALNIEFEIFFESFFHKFSRVLTICIPTHKKMLRLNILVLLLRMVEHVQIALNIEFEDLFESFLHSFSQCHILYTNMQKDVAIKHSNFTA